MSGPVSGLTITRVTMTTFNIIWTAPSIANGVIQYYVITVNKEGDHLMTEYNTTSEETSVTVNELGNYNALNQ